MTFTFLYYETTTRWSYVHWGMKTTTSRKMLLEATGFKIRFRWHLNNKVLSALTASERQRQIFSLFSDEYSPGDS